MVVAYVRISSNKQDMDTQRLALLSYAQQNGLMIGEFIEVQESAAKTQKQRKINELQERLKNGDILLVYDISRLGRSMFEVINLILELSQKGVQFVFLKQLELSNFNNIHAKLLLTFYAYVAEIERNFISERTKTGLQKARANGRILGRPRGTYSSIFDENTEGIKELLEKELNPASVWKLIGKKGTYSAFYYFCRKRKLIKKGEKN